MKCAEVVGLTAALLHPGASCGSNASMHPASAPARVEPNDALLAASTGAPLAASATATATATATPLAAEGAVPLAVPGFRDAVVVVPSGAVGRKPVVLALHGNFDRPEWQCDVWRTIVRDRAFILCPRGKPRPDAPPPLDRYTYGTAAQLEQEIDAGLAALRARFAGYVDDGEVVYTGFSLGAILGASIVTRQPARFPRAVLIEGGHSAWSKDRAAVYARGGGRKVLFACGQPACRSDARAPAKLLNQVNVQTRIVDGGNVGHTYDGTVARAVDAAFSWLVEDDPRFGS